MHSSKLNQYVADQCFEKDHPSNSLT